MKRVSAKFHRTRMTFVILIAEIMNELSQPAGEGMWTGTGPRTQRRRVEKFHPNCFVPFCSLSLKQVQPAEPAIISIMRTLFQLLIVCSRRRPSSTVRQ